MEDSGDAPASVSSSLSLQRLDLPELVPELVNLSEISCPLLNSEGVCRVLSEAIDESDSSCWSQRAMCEGTVTPLSGPTVKKQINKSVLYMQVMKLPDIHVLLQLSRPVSWLASTGVSTSWIALSSCCSVIISKKPSLTRVTGGFAARGGWRCPEWRTDAGPGPAAASLWTLKHKRNNQSEIWTKKIMCTVSFLKTMYYSTFYFNASDLAPQLYMFALSWCYP